MQSIHEEYQYINFIDEIIKKGHWEQTRNGKTKSLFGHMMRFSLQNSTIPIITTKKVAWKTCLKELLWFIRGDTDNKILKEQNVHIWDANGCREFLDSRLLFDYEEDELGPIYGWQWRHFNKPYISKKDRRFNENLQTSDENFNTLINSQNTFDQLQEIIDCLKDPTQRTSRRLVMSAWNPCQLDEMALPPCHVLCQFNVHDGNKLSCALYQRSGDFLLGIPFNITSYAFLTHLIAKHCGLEAYEFVHFVGNCHIYEEHMEGSIEQVSRQPLEFPTVTIKQIRENINDYEVNDFEIHGYKHHEPIKFKMVA